MLKSLIVAMVLAASPAVADPTAVIVYSSGTNGDWTEKYWHEMAHANGWTHPKASLTGKAYQPPAKYLYVYPGPIRLPCGDGPCSLREAQKLCGGHFACQWFE